MQYFVEIFEFCMQIEPYKHIVIEFTGKNIFISQKCQKRLLPNDFCDFRKNWKNAILELCFFLYKNVL